ncbi:hypothetical protein GGI43DRAFT_13206 [Trichoderma evansii]
MIIKSNLLAASPESSAAVKGNCQGISGSPRSVLVLVLLIGAIRCFASRIYYIASGQVIGEHMASFLLLLSTYSIRQRTDPWEFTWQVDQRGPSLASKVPSSKRKRLRAFHLACRGSFPGAAVGSFLPAAEASFRYTALQLGDFVFSWGSGPLALA